MQLQELCCCSAVMLIWKIHCLPPLFSTTIDNQSFSLQWSNWSNHLNAKFDFLQQYESQFSKHVSVKSRAIYIHFMYKKYKRSASGFQSNFCYYWIVPKDFKSNVTTFILPNGKKETILAKKQFLELDRSKTRKFIEICMILPGPKITRNPTSQVCFICRGT